MNLTDVMKLSEDEARDYLEKIRWPNGANCAHCRSKEVTKLKGNSTRPGVYKCRTCRKQFSVTVGTIFDRSHIPLSKWIAAFFLLCSSKKGISALQLKRNLGLAYKSAWHMSHRIRYAMHLNPSFANQLQGQVEVDESYFGGKAHNRKYGPEPKKYAVLALVERNGQARCRALNSLGAQEIKGAINKHVNMFSTIHTDEFSSYSGIGEEFAGGHTTVNHGQKEYRRGNASTNTVESYFSLMKRGVTGVYHHVSEQHLGRYCDEFAFRWSHRKTNDDERTEVALGQAEGKRLTYSETSSKKGIARKRGNVG